MMKRTSTILLSITLGVLIGYSLGYLKLPQLDESADFFLGFGASFLAIILLVLLKGGKASINFGKSLILFLAIFTAAFGAKLYLDSQRLLRKEQSKAEINSINSKLELIASELAMKQIQKVDFHISRLKQDSIISLGIEDIAELAKLSLSLDTIKNYPSADGSASLSPGRGKLFIDLLNLKIDSTSLSTALKTINFSYADLRKVDLRNQNLKSIDLSYACLIDAILDSAILSNAILKGAVLNLATLKDSHLNGASLESASLKWVNLTGSNLSKSYFVGADFYNSILVNSNIDGSKGSFSNFKNAILTNTSFIGTDLFGCNFENADLTNSNLSKARLRISNLKNTNLTNCNLEFLVINPDWFKKNKDFNIIGYSAIEKANQIVAGSIEEFPLDKYYLQQKN